MNLYLISQTANDDYDTFDEAVVAAIDEEQARNIEPQYSFSRDKVKFIDKSDEFNHKWVNDPNLVTAKLIGTTDLYTEPCVICASFNAG